ncbi:MAG: hypothetical protein WDZ94_05200 [Patescibacteria group bacterium]
MLEDYTLAQVKSLTENAQSILIVCADPDELDCVSAATAWHVTLQAQGKDSRLATPTPSTLPEIMDKNGKNQQALLSGVDELSTDLGNENLTISFDYSEEQVDKVSYNISEDNKKFFLTIKPKSGRQPLDTSKVEFSYTGASADLLLIFGANTPSELGQLYTDYEDLYTNTSSIVISDAPEFGSLKIPLEGELLTTVTMEIFTALQQELPSEAASNLLYGIDASTFGLQQVSSAATLEQVATLLRAGGHRLWKPSAAATSVPNKSTTAQNGKKAQQEINVQSKKKK